MSHWGIEGHEWAVEYLQRSIAAGTLAHAWLFSGPPGLGKRLLALRLAQALCCEQSPGDPCLSCRNCRRIERGNHPDVRISGMESQAAGLKAEEAARQKELKIATVRAWQQDVALRPYEAARRVLILHDAELLSEGAANAMLKTLEEPPAHALLILVADSATLLPTIVSRCRSLRLRTVPRARIIGALQARGADPARAELLAALSGGRIGWAVARLNDPDELRRREEQLTVLQQLAGADRSSGLRWAEQRSKEYRAGDQALVFDWLLLWQSWWRDVLLTAVDAGDAVVNVDQRALLAAVARSVPPAVAAAYLQRLNLAVRQLRENTNPQLVLESLTFHLPRAGS
jgi:DNA polymerase III subunit delta'